MATQSLTITFNNTSNAGIRAWGSAVSTAIQACGLIKTTDTGQIDWTTTTATATSSNQVFGYEIYRLNDSLQTGGKPIYIKIEYGTSANASGQGPTLTPGIYTTIGHSTDGAGTINSPTQSPRFQHCSYTMGSAASVPCLFAGDGTYFWMIFGSTFNNSGNPGNSTMYNTPWAFFAFDRTRNADGSANGDGWWTVRSCWSYDGRSTYSFPANYLNASLNSTLPCAWREDLAFVDRATNWGRTFYCVSMSPGDLVGTGADGTDITFYPLLFQSGRLTYNNTFLVAYNSDVTHLTSYTTTVLGTSHTYMCLKFTPTGNTNHAMLLRYE